jgi:hypothetical protein
MLEKGISEWIASLTLICMNADDNEDAWDSGEIEMPIDRLCHILRLNLSLQIHSGQGVHKYD